MRHAIEPRPPRSTRSPVSVLAGWAACVIGLAAGAWLVLLLCRHDAAEAHWALQALLAVGAVVAVASGPWYRRHLWDAPVRRLGQRLADVHKGLLPVDSLEDVEPHLRPLAKIIAEVLRDLRQQRSVVGQLNAEMRQRVAHRTDALERLIGSLRQQASRDALTGLFNRRLLDQHLPQLIDRCRADAAELSLLMIDVDNFKLLNDSKGHAAGDEFLRSVGQLIRSSIRQDDLAFRCGGDEFVIVLPGAGKRVAQMLADRLGSLVDALARTVRVARPPRLSIGLAVLGEIAEATSGRLLEQADQNLYKVKSEHRRAYGSVLTHPHFPPRVG